MADAVKGCEISVTGVCYRADGLLEKEREARARYVDFCKETGLKEQPERFRSANIFNNTNKQKC